MLSLRKHIIICASLFGAMIGIPIVGNVLAAAGVIHGVGALQLPLMILIFILFAAFGFSAIPVIVMLVLGAQRKIGNENVPAVAAALRAQSTIVYAIWAIMALGCLIAIPAAIMGGLFKPG